MRNEGFIKLLHENMNTPASVHMKNNDEPWELEKMTLFSSNESFDFMQGVLDTGEKILINVGDISAIVYDLEGIEE